jgi:exodeoxyribonuclease VII large subunit
MVVESFEPTGQGALLKLLEERKARLAAEGLFDPARKKPLPPYPQKIGIVTSPTGAVIKDILHRLEDRFPCHVLIWPVLVQGQGAAEQIAAAIEGFNKLASPPDLIIVARGGGSLEDLWAFNEEIVVRAAAASGIPLISAVGHETDTTLIDYASDYRAPTPTAAAEKAVPVLMELWTYLQDRQQRLTAIMVHELERHKTILLAASRGLPDLTRLIEDKMQRLDDWGERLPSLLRNCIQNMEHRFTSILSQQFRQNARRYYELVQQKFDLLTSRLDHASYQRILDRGFCWTTATDGTFITRAKQIKKGAALDLHFVDGTVPVVEASSPVVKEKKQGPDDRQGKLF